ncbi:hypothetical protein MUB15_02875 [Priestia sp. OVS21]|nr:hypothetical protein [Priestia sp. OVS21]
MHDKAEKRERGLSSPSRFSFVIPLFIELLVSLLSIYVPNLRGLQYDLNSHPKNLYSLEHFQPVAKEKSDFLDIATTALYKTLKHILHLLIYMGSH